jgi:DNA-directed RNA polymerase subunit RPC12/RpoP
MNILKHGSLEKAFKYDNAHFYMAFECDRCGCQFTADPRKKEIMTSQYDGDSAICPECGFQTYHSINLDDVEVEYDEFEEDRYSDDEFLKV